MDNKVSNLKKSIHMLLCDQFDSVDLELRSSDDTFVEYIIDALIQKNEDRCPFKNYDVMHMCKLNACCEYDPLIDCFRECEDVWKEFTGIDESEGE